MGDPIITPVLVLLVVSAVVIAGPILAKGAKVVYRVAKEGARKVKEKVEDFIRRRRRRSKSPRSRHCPGNSSRGSDDRVRSREKRKSRNRSRSRSVSSSRSESSLARRRNLNYATLISLRAAQMITEVAAAGFIFISSVRSESALALTRIRTRVIAGSCERERLAAEARDGVFNAKTQHWADLKSSYRTEQRQRRQLRTKLDESRHSAETGGISASVLKRGFALVLVLALLSYFGDNGVTRTAEDKDGNRDAAQPSSTSNQAQQSSPTSGQQTASVSSTSSGTLSSSGGQAPTPPDQWKQRAASNESLTGFDVLFKSLQHIIARELRRTRVRQLNQTTLMFQAEFEDLAEYGISFVKQVDDAVQWAIEQTSTHGNVSVPVDVADVPRFLLHFAPWYELYLAIARQVNFAFRNAIEVHSAAGVDRYRAAQMEMAGYNVTRDLVSGIRDELEKRLRYSGNEGFSMPTAVPVAKDPLDFVKDRQNVDGIGFSSLATLLYHYVKHALVFPADSRGRNEWQQLHAFLEDSDQSGVRSPGDYVREALAFVRDNCGLWRLNPSNWDYRTGGRLKVEVKTANATAAFTVSEMIASMRDLWLSTYFNHTIT